MTQAQCTMFDLSNFMEWFFFDRHVYGMVGGGLRLGFFSLLIGKKKKIHYGKQCWKIMHKIHDSRKFGDVASGTWHIIRRLLMCELGKERGFFENINNKIITF